MCQNGIDWSKAGDIEVAKYWGEMKTGAWLFTGTGKVLESV